MTAYFPKPQSLNPKTGKQGFGLKFEDHGLRFCFLVFRMSFWV